MADNNSWYRWTYLLGSISSGLLAIESFRLARFYSNLRKKLDSTPPLNVGELSEKHCDGQYHLVSGIVKSPNQQVVLTDETYCKPGTNATLHYEEFHVASDLHLCDVKSTKKIPLEITPSAIGLQTHKDRKYFHTSLLGSFDRVSLKMLASSSLLFCAQVEANTDGSLQLTDVCMYSCGLDFSTYLR